MGPNKSTNSWSRRQTRGPEAPYQLARVGLIPILIVTIKVVDLDEMPKIDAYPADASLIEHKGGNAIEYIETGITDGSPSVATYTITDDDEGTPVLSVSGADAAMFTIKYNTANAA